MFQDSEVVKSREERTPKERPLIPCSGGRWGFGESTSCAVMETAVSAREGAR